MEHIPPTLSTTDAARRRWDLIVIGAGCAGSAAAIEAARARLKVLLIDRARFPREKVCGGCLNARALRICEHLRVDLTAAQSLHCLELRSGSACARLRLLRGAALSRVRLDAALVQRAIADGAHFLPETSARCVAPGSVIAGPVRLSASYVIAADGIRGRAAPGQGRTRLQTEPGAPIGIGATWQPSQSCGWIEPGCIHMVIGRGMYGGFVLLDRHTVHCAVALPPAALREAGSPARVIRELAASAGQSCPADTELARWRGTPRMTRMRERVWSERLLIVGDSAGYVEPFTGQGIAWALESGCAAAHCAIESRSKWSDAVGMEWQTLQDRTIRARQALCRSLSPLLRRERTGHLIVRILSAAPLLAGPFIRATSTDRQFRGYSS